MEPTLWDHAFALVAFVIFPLYAKLTIAGELDRIRRHGEPVRVRAYQRIILTWLLFSGYLLILWLLLDRDWASLGLRGVAPVPLAVAVGVALAVTAAVVIPLRTISRSKERHGELDKHLGELTLFMPESKKEETWFKIVSTNAGLCEELVFRAYLIWYLGHFVGTWLSAAIAVVAFAYAHIYQGIRQLPSMLLVSAVVVGLYVYTESLLVPVLFHIALDAMQGHYIARIRRSQAAARSSVG